MRSRTLADPAGLLMRPTRPIEAGDSLALAATRLREEGAAVLPVLRDDRLGGVLTEARLAAALGAGVDPTDAAGDWLEPAHTIRPYETGAEALRRMEGGTTLVVVDDDQRVVGLLAATDLWPRHRVPPRPPLVGGMATPFGVYLTTGTVRGGVPPWALVATGAFLFTVLALGAGLANGLANFALTRGVSAEAADFLAGFLAVAIFLLALRLLPLSGTHGAEHQVVHAIEREEELEPRVVRRMPRVHPRCGTNLAVGATLFLALFDGLPFKESELRLLPALLVTLFAYRPLGAALQKWVTTKRPSDRQVAQAIRAGRELLERYAAAPRMSASVGRRLWNSGLFHVMAGSSIAAAVLTAMSRAFGIDLGL